MKLMFIKIKKVFFWVISIIIVLFFAVCLQIVYKILTEEYAVPPRAAIANDFPPHNIDIRKYYDPIPERKWDSRIQVPQSMIDELLAVQGTSATQESAYVGIYNHLQTGILYKDVFQHFDQNVDVPFEAEFDVCIDRAKEQLSETRNAICREERIEHQFNEEQLTRLIEDEKKGSITEGGRKLLAGYRSDPDSIYDDCFPAAQIMHDLHMRQYIAWDHCAEDFVQKLRSAGHIPQ